MFFGSVTIGYLTPFTCQKLKPMMHSLIVPYKEEKEECRDILQRIGQSDVAHPDSTVCIWWIPSFYCFGLVLTDIFQNPNMRNDMRDTEDRDRTGETAAFNVAYPSWTP